MLFFIIFLVIWIFISFKWCSFKYFLDMLSLRRYLHKDHKKFSSVEDMAEFFNKKKPLIESVRLNVVYYVEHFIVIPRNIYLWIKYGIQRWKRGWSDQDAYGIDSYLCQIIPAMIKRLKITKHGVPICVGNMETNEEIEQAEKQWEEILDNIIYTFEQKIKPQSTGGARG